MFEKLVNIESIYEIITYSVPYGIEPEEILNVMKKISKIE